MTTQYLEFAELQALKHNAMYMKDWIDRLHKFLTLNENEILMHSGKISAQQAKEYAINEYEKYRIMINETEPDELDKAIKQLNEKNDK